MKKRFTEEQVLKILNEANTSTTVEEACRQNNISKTTFYAWKKKFEGLTIQDIKRLKILEKENLSLKKIVADLSLKIEALQDVLSKKW
jgi:putative transposase